MDVTFRTRVLPQNQTSVKALGFSLAPGGKGLWQAVAAAKLGLDVALVAAVADDHFGREIDSYLRSHGIDTSLLKVIKDAHTPFTGVIEFVRGDSLALTWPNETEISLSAQDIDELRGDFADCDAVLITFEIPRETLEHTLSLINKLDEPRPIVIVTAGQPYNAAISAQAFSRIDYLVAHEWELGPLASADRESFAIETAAQRLLALGVETLCIPNLKGCTVYSEAFAKYAVPIFQSTYKESAAARDAFCAALAAKLLDDGQFSEEVALWATTAMAAAIANHPLPNPMPDRNLINQLFQRFRHTAISDGVQVNAGDGAYP